MRTLAAAAAALAAVLLPTAAAAAAVADEVEPVEVVFYGSTDCEFSTSMFEFLDDLAADPLVTLTPVDVDTPGGADEFEAHFAALGQVPDAIPAVVVGWSTFIGDDDDIRADIDAEIDYILEVGPPPSRVPPAGELDSPDDVDPDAVPADDPTGAAPPPPPPPPPGADEDWDAEPELAAAPADTGDTPAQGGGTLTIVAAAVVFAALLAVQLARRRGPVQPAGTGGPSSV